MPIASRLRLAPALTAPLGLVALLGFVAGCPDSPHLNLPGADDGDAGADAPKSCVSNAQCAYPNGVCDVARATCVECLVLSDCSPGTGAVCSAGKCACADASASFCRAAGTTKDRCVDLTLTAADCGACGRTCLGTCVAGVCADGWQAITAFNAPEKRARHVAVWDDADGAMIVWGGIQGNRVLGSGAIYTLSANRWVPVSPINAPDPRHGATAVWDDADGAMIVWGGMATRDDGWLNTGGMFYPATNTWKPLPTGGAPSGRVGHVAVWDSAHKSMIVWGGNNTDRLRDGGVFDTVAKKWTPIQAAQISPRTGSAGVFNGTSLLVWGGADFDGMANKDVFRNDGATWSAMGGWGDLPGGQPPGPRSLATAVWTGTSMLVWGGQDEAGPRDDGGAYKNNAWSPIKPDAAAGARRRHTAVWSPMTGEMVVWGGDSGNGLLNTGARLKEMGVAWTPIPPALAPRQDHTAVLAGTKLIVWGGDVGNNNTANDGGIFDLAMASP